MGGLIRLDNSFQQSPVKIPLPEWEFNAEGKGREVIGLVNNFGGPAGINFQDPAQGPFCATHGKQFAGFLQKEPLLRFRPSGIKGNIEPTSQLGQKGGGGGVRA